MSELDQLIKNIEDSNATGRWATSAATINPVLIGLGGKPICIDESHHDARDGSLLSEINGYMTLLAIRNILEEVK